MHVNVADQYNDEESLLHFVRRLTARYRMSPEIGWGAFECLEQPARTVLAHSVRTETARMVAVHNFAGTAAATRLVLADEPPDTALVDLFSPERIALDERGAMDLDVAPYGHRWFRVARPGDQRLT